MSYGERMLWAVLWLLVGFSLVVWAMRLLNPPVGQTARPSGVV